MENEGKKAKQNPWIIILSVFGLLSASCLAYEVFIGVLPIHLRIQELLITLAGLAPFACIAWGIWDTIHKKRVSAGLILGIINMGITGITTVAFILTLVIGIITWDPQGGSWLIIV